MDSRGRHRPTGLPAHSPLHRETSLRKKQLRTNRAKELTVETGVEIALARRAFAGIADHARLFPARSPFECIGGTSRLWELSPQRGRDGVEVMLARTVMDGHLSACRNETNGFSFKERFSGEEGPMELTFGCLVILGREDLGHEVRKTVVAKQSARSVQFPPPPRNRTPRPDSTDSLARGALRLRGTVQTPRRRSPMQRRIRLRCLLRRKRSCKTRCGPVFATNTGFDPVTRGTTDQRL